MVDDLNDKATIDDDVLSADDMLEEERSINNDTVVPLPQYDDDNPSGPADDPVNVIIPPDHPSTDTDIDETEKYQDGIGESVRGA